MVVPCTKLIDGRGEWEDRLDIPTIDYADQLETITYTFTVRGPRMPSSMIDRVWIGRLGSRTPDVPTIGVFPPLRKDLLSKRVVLNVQSEGLGFFTDAICSAPTAGVARNKHESRSF